MIFECNVDVSENGDTGHMEIVCCLYQSNMTGGNPPFIHDFPMFFPLKSQFIEDIEVS